MTSHNTGRDCEIPYVRVERGTKHFKRARRCVVFGENALDWILSLSKKDWSEVGWFPSSALGPTEKAALTLAALPLIGGRLLLPDETTQASNDCDILLGSGLVGHLLMDLEALDPSTLAILVLSGTH
jgi:hypothetical protein